MRQRRHRRSGRGRVYLRGSRWWLSYWHDGRRHHESSRSARRSVALQMLAERVARLRPDPHAADATVREVLDALCGDLTMRGRRAVRRVRIAARHLVEHFGADKLAREITTLDVDAFQLARLRAGRGPGTARLEAAILRRALRLSVELERLPRAPKVRLLPAPPARSGFVERPDLDRILQHLPEHVRPVVLVAFLCGWRLKSELLTLTWSDVTFADPAVMRLDAAKSKTATAREYPLLGELLDVVKTQRARASAIEARTGKPLPWVFFRPDGQRLQTIVSAWRRAATLAGLAALRPHSLRRSHARGLIRAGVDAHTVMALCGWKTRTMLDRYHIVDTPVLVEGVAKFVRNQRQSEDRSRATLSVADASQPPTPAASIEDTTPQHPEPQA